MGIRPLLIAAVLACASAPAAAQGILRIDRAEGGGAVPGGLATQGLHIESQKVDVRVAGRAAKTAIEQHYRNETAQVLEGTYFFPVPAGASVSELLLDVAGRPMKAELLERKRARDIYDSIVRSRKDPAILEHVGKDLFRAQVFPIAAHGLTRIQLEYEQLLAKQGRLSVYRFPL
ncbi:MAG: VIT domain-containing protein, partial [Planctomycetota bacterium]